MNRMKKSIIKRMANSLLFMLVSVFPSCLKNDLPDLPAFEEANITDVKFDFRYKDPTDTWITGEPVVKVVALTVNADEKVIDATKATVICTITVPAANAPFTEEIRSTVSLTNIVGKFNISTAAVIKPLDDSPTLGTPGDFSAPRKYEITAANGIKKVWTVHVTALNK